MVGGTGKGAKECTSWLFFFLISEKVSLFEAKEETVNILEHSFLPGTFLPLVHFFSPKYTNPFP